MNARLRVIGLVSVFLLYAGALPANGQTAGAQPAEIHFLIPTGPNSGLEITAYAIGKALTESGLINSASYENVSGAGGGKAIKSLIENSDDQQDTLMVTSTRIIVNSLQGHHPYSFRDLTPIVALLGDYGAFVVKTDSPFQSWQDAVNGLKAGPESIRVAGGSPPGGQDYLVAALAFRAAGLDLKRLDYVGYDGGGSALNSLLLGHTQLLATSFGEVIKETQAGKVRVLAITAPERIAQAPDVPTLKELGNEVEFINWRGVFAAPGLPDARADAYAALLGKLHETAVWKDVLEQRAWVDFYKPRAEFVTFLNEQEQAFESLLQQVRTEPVR